MKIPYFEVLAFTDRLFAGNPAGVCLLEKDWLPEELMLQVATENDLAETAFLVERDGYFDLRWFTPVYEVDLCGHATLGSAHVLFNHRGYKGESIRFKTKTSGDLNVTRDGDRLVLDFPALFPERSDVLPAVTEAIGAKPRELWKGRDYFAVFEREEDVSGIKPDFAKVCALDKQGVVVTAPGNECDFVSRYFVPGAGIPEDPVTGSTHCVLIPYWAKRLQKKELHARQLSPRGGELFCEDRGERVRIGGNARTYLEGEIMVR